MPDHRTGRATGVTDEFEGTESGSHPAPHHSSWPVPRLTTEVAGAVRTLVTGRPPAAGLRADLRQARRARGDRRGHRQRSRVEHRHELRRRFGEVGRGATPLVGEEASARALRVRRMRREDAGCGPLAVAAVLRRLRLRRRWRYSRVAVTADIASHLWPTQEVERLRRETFASCRAWLRVARPVARPLHAAGRRACRRPSRGVQSQRRRETDRSGPQVCCVHCRRSQACRVDGTRIDH